MHIAFNSPRRYPGFIHLIVIIFSLMTLTACVSNSSTTVTRPVHVNLQSETTELARQAWPVVQDISQPDSLRPCCAFGYNLKVEIGGIPVPFYSIGNIVEADSLGQHGYNDNPMQTLADLLGLNNEKVGLIYTHDGGFIDIAHVRDTADYVLFLFSHIQSHLGEDWTLTLGDELATRQLRLFASQPPADPIQRYTLSAYLAADTAYRLAVWHEIAQWYGYRSFWMFSEAVSAFSPEDLYSNLLGARLALSIILQGNATSREQFSAAMTKALPEVLHALGAVPTAQTAAMFDSVDSLWWDSQRRLPEKFLVLKRDYNTSSHRAPSIPPGETAQALPLQIPENMNGYNIHTFGELRMLPTDHMVDLPAPVEYWAVKDFQSLADHARQTDDLLLRAFLQ